MAAPSKSPEMPKVELYTGAEMPQLAFDCAFSAYTPNRDGTFNEYIVQTFRAAIRKGCRHFRLRDNYILNGTEQGVGSAIEAVTKEDGIPREKLFVTAHVRVDEEDIRAAFNSCLQRFGLDYVDLYSIDISTAYDFSDEAVLKVWRDMEDLHLAAPDSARAIGIISAISHREKMQMESILHRNDLRVRPAVCRTAFTPVNKLSKTELSGIYKEVRIQNLPDSSCSFGRLPKHELRKRLFEVDDVGYNPTIEDIQKANKKLVQWHLKQDVTLVAENFERMDEYLSALDTEIEEELMELITTGGGDLC